MHDCVLCRSEVYFEYLPTFCCMICVMPKRDNTNDPGFFEDHWEPPWKWSIELNIVRGALSKEELFKISISISYHFYFCILCIWNWNRNTNAYNFVKYFLSLEDLFDVLGWNLFLGSILHLKKLTLLEALSWKQTSSGASFFY